MIERANWFDELYERYQSDPEYLTEEIKLAFTEELADLMDQSGVSRADLARRLGTSRAYVTKIFRGQFNPTVETLVKLALAANGRVILGLQPGQRASARPARNHIPRHPSVEVACVREPMVKYRAGRNRK